MSPQPISAEKKETARQTVNTASSASCPVGSGGEKNPGQPQTCAPVAGSRPTLCYGGGRRTLHARRRRTQSNLPFSCHVYFGCSGLGAHVANHVLLGDAGSLLLRASPGPTCHDNIEAAFWLIGVSLVSSWPHTELGDRCPADTNSPIEVRWGMSFPDRIVRIA